MCTHMPLNQVTLDSLFLHRNEHAFKQKLSACQSLLRSIDDC